MLKRRLNQVPKGDYEDESMGECEGRGLPKRRPESRTIGLFIRLLSPASRLKEDP